MTMGNQSGAAQAHAAALAKLREEHQKELTQVPAGRSAPPRCASALPSRCNLAVQSQSTWQAQLLGMRAEQQKQLELV
jgi:hypothetical protein